MAKLAQLLEVFGSAGGRSGQSVRFCTFERVQSGAKRENLGEEWSERDGNEEKGGEGLSVSCGEIYMQASIFSNVLSACSKKP